MERDQVAAVLKRRPGLLIGPAQTLYPGAMTDFARSLTGKDASLPLATAPADGAARLKAFLPNAIGKHPVGGATAVLGKVRWAAVLSLSPDGSFDDAFAGEAAKRPTRSIPSVLEPPSTTPPAHSTPVIKLLGSAIRDTYALSRAERTRMKSAWARLARLFVDELKGAPVVCVGLEDNVTELHELISLLMGLPQGIPSAWIFPQGDRTPELADLETTLVGRAMVVQTSLTIGELTAVIQNVRIVTAGKSVAPSEQWPNISLASFSHIATLINPFTSRASRNTISASSLDLLFTPASLDWEPFVDRLDFSRSQTSTIVHDAQQAIASSRSSAIVVLGSAATGKTTLLKRLGLDLAAAGQMSIWLRPPQGVDPGLSLRDLVTRIADARPAGKSVVFLADDSLSRDAGLLRTLVGACEARGLSILLLTSCRTSEWETEDADTFTGGLLLAAKHELDDDLDSAELAALPAYLAKIRITQDTRAAKLLVDNATTRHASDLLGLFYLLLPSIRNVLRLSIQDEYFRLGDRSLVARKLAEATQGSSDILRKAYELVAVSCFHKTPVPVEVLVSALDVSYTRWLQETDGKDTAWGVLYIADDDDFDDARYQTRNSVVTDIIVRTVNGDSIRPKNQVACLRALLSACTGSNLTYRDYCEEILVDNKEVLAERFSYEDGLDLYDAAIGALPSRDKALEHHKGLWIKNTGRNPLDAIKQFDVALATAAYPGSSRVESDENIFTSKAAAILDGIEAGIINQDVGKKEILHNLEKSEAFGQHVNPKAVHVRANMLYKLLERLGTSTPADVALLSNHALGALDSAVTMYSGARDANEKHKKNLGMLRDVRSRLLARLKTPEELEGWANELWTSQRDQQGFTLAARALLSAARDQKKGGAFKPAFDYVEDAIRIVENAGGAPSSDLLRVGIYALYEWRVARPAGSDLSHVWRGLEILFAKYVQSSHQLTDPHVLYVGAIALCHLGSFQDAKAYFSRLRGIRLPPDVVFATRDYLMNTNGTKRHLFGQVKRGGKENFLVIQELGEDFHVDKGDNWPAAGATVKASVGFSYGGPTAYRI